MAIAALARASMIGLVVSALPVALAAAQPAAAQGETWEHTMQMTAMGMSMPARTVTSCQAKGAERAAPQMPDESCTMTEAQLAGSRMSFKVTCTQPEPMTGTGEMTWNGQNAYAGTMTMTSPDGTMAMKTSGRRLGAACDPGADERAIAALVDKGNALADKFAAMQQAQQVKVCGDYAAAGNPAVFAGAPPLCADSALFCSNLRTEAGFARTGALGGDLVLAQAGEVCGVSPASLRADLCGVALKNESLAFLSSSCPEQSKVIVQRECAGRKFTSDVGAKYQDFCASFFAATLTGDAAAAPASTTAKPADAKSGAVEGARRRLGGLIRR